LLVGIKRGPTHLLRFEEMIAFRVADTVRSGWWSLLRTPSRQDLCSPGTATPLPNRPAAHTCLVDGNPFVARPDRHHSSQLQQLPSLH